MVTIGTVAVNITGDIGGTGISRFRFQRQDAATPTVADCNTAGAAVRALWNAFTNYLPSTVTVTTQPTVELNVEDTGLVQGSLLMTAVPAVVTGIGATTYAAGMGARLNWLTSSLHGRRLIQGNTRLVPFSGGAYSSTGALLASVVTAVGAAAGTYIAATGGGTIEYIVWHRPPKGTFSGGAVGLITGYKVPTTPTGLRSRRS